MDAFWIPIISAAASVVANAIYISFVKKDLDHKLESYKIAYSGIFKEKLELYKNVIENMEKLKDTVLKYAHQGSHSNINPRDIMVEINNFIKLNEHGAIFYSDHIKSIVSDIRKEFQEIFELSYKKYHLDKDSLTVEEFEQYLLKLSALTNGKNYLVLKQKLIESIRADFNIK